MGGQSPAQTVCKRMVQPLHVQSQYVFSALTSGCKKKQSNDPTSHLIYDLGKDLPANPMVSFTGFKPFSLQYDMAF